MSKGNHVTYCSRILEELVRIGTPISARQLKRKSGWISNTYRYVQDIRAVLYHLVDEGEIQMEQVDGRDLFYVPCQG